MIQIEIGLLVSLRSIDVEEELHSTLSTLNVGKVNLVFVSGNVEGCLFQGFGQPNLAILSESEESIGLGSISCTLWKTIP